MNISFFVYTFIFLSTIVHLLYKFIKSRFQYWENLGVISVPNPHIFFGHDKDFVLRKKNLGENAATIYKQLAPHKYGGAYSFFNPVLYIRDPDLIKDILVNDFENFVNRDSRPRSDVLTEHLLFMMDDRWKNLRGKLTPTFTSSKMKGMFSLIKDCSNSLMAYLEKKAISGENVNMKDVMARYTTDVISSCGFGIESNTLNGQNTRFRAMGDKMLSPTPRFIFFQILFNISAKIPKWIGLKPFPKDVADFFIDLVRDTIEFRRRNNIQRNDFLGLIIKIWDDDQATENESEKINLTLELVAAQCLLFFFAGFDTTSTTLTIICLNLAQTPEVQKKLQNEVDQVMYKYNGDVTYEAIQEMPFMDQVINESMRLYAASPVLLRSCTKDYQIPGTQVVIKKGTNVIIPTHGLHRDIKYFAEPDTFNPDNFSTEAKSMRNPYVFLPFGEGPRHCIGLRFSFVQFKTALTMMMKSYNLSVSLDMKLPLELKPGAIFTSPKNDVLIKYSKRS